MLIFLFLLIIDLYFLIPAAFAQIFNPIAELVIPINIPSNEAKAEIEIHPAIVEAKIKNTNIFVLFIHRFILLYFFKEIISCFIYIFQFKFLAYVFFNHIFKEITYFQLNQEFLISHLILLL